MRFEVTVNTQEAYPVISLKDSQSGCQAEVYAFGGLLNAFRLPTPKGVINVIEGFSSVADAQQNITKGFRSAKLSPFACRLTKGSYRFQDKPYKVESHYMGEHAIHGLLYNIAFDVTGSSADETCAQVTLHHHYTGTDAGYPFAYEVTITWKLQAGNHLAVTTTVQHNNTTPIPFIDGWHPYFTLGSTIDACTLQFNSGLQLEFSADLLPTGNTLPDARFVNGASLKGVALDNSFLLDPQKEASRCVFSNDHLQLTIEPDVSYPYLQIYTPPSRKSIAIENLTGAPDAFNNGIGLIVLQPLEKRSFTTNYTLS